MERVGGLGPAHVAEIVRGAATTRPQPSVVFFDVGGVLASDGLPAHGVAEILAQIKLDVEPHALIAAGKELWNKVKVGTITSDEFYASLLAAVGEKPEHGAALHKAHLDYLSRFATDGRAARILEVLKRVQSSGYIVGIISNHVASWLSEVFTRSGFDEVVALESPLFVVSDTAACAKPDAAIFKVALDRLRAHVGAGSSLASLEDGELAQRCIFVDNKQTNVTAAEDSGFLGLLYEAYTSTEDVLETSLLAAGVCLEPADDH